MKRSIFIVLLLCTTILFAKNEFKIIDAEKTQELIKKGAVLIDNRPDFKFKKGHIEGATNLTFFKKGHYTNKMTKKNLLKTIGSNKTVIFYCSGRQRAYHAIKQATEWGVKANIYWYKNGFEEWKSKDLPFKK